MTRPRSIAAALATIAALAATLAPGISGPAVADPTAPQAAADVVPRAAATAAQPGRPLPAIPRLPDGALLVGADQRYALYHADQFDPTTNRQVLRLVRLRDGRVVRTLLGSDVPCCFRTQVRYADGSILVVMGDGAVVRTDALTGEETGRLEPIEDSPVLALDDRWVLTPTVVRFFDGRVVPVLGELPSDPYERPIERTWGDSSIAVLTDSGGGRPLVLTPGTGQLVALARPDESVRVFAVRGGALPEVFGRVQPLPGSGGSDGSGEGDGGEQEERDDGLARWTDPARAAGRTVVPSTIQPTLGGGFAGDRLVVTREANGVPSVVELDPSTGRATRSLVTGVLRRSTLGFPVVSAGDVVVQAGDQVLVSRTNGGRGGLSLVTETGTRTLPALPPARHTVCRLVRAGGRLDADLCRGPQYLESRTITTGDRTWREVDGPVGYDTSSSPLGQAPRATCPDGSRAEVVRARGRWLLERCRGGFRWFVTDTHERLPPFPVRGEPELGVDHVLERVKSPTPGRDVLRVTGLDVRHRTRLFGPLGVDFAVDSRGGQAPVYVDAIGRVRVADASGLADSVPPSLTVVRRPPTLVDAVRSTRVTIAGRASDAVDGRRVAIQLQVRRMKRDAAESRPWRTRPASPSGSFTVTMAPGEQWCFRLVAYDRSGNRRIATPSCSTVPVDDVDLSRTGLVGRVRGDYLGGSASVLDGRGALGHDGIEGAQAVAWVRTGPGRGQLVARDTQGVVVQRVDTASRRPGLRRVPLGRPGSYLRLESADSRPVVVDALGHRRRG